MENTFINIVQKCIYVDFLLNYLIESNYYQYSSLLKSMKDTNIKNLKFLCYLYKSIYNNELSFENSGNLQLSKIYNNNLTSILELTLNIVTELEYIKRFYVNSTYFNLIQNLINSYFNFISLINCFNPCHSNHNSLSSCNNRSLDFFSMVTSSYESTQLKNISHDLLRNISLEAINYFFDYQLNSNNISDEFYDVFFSNSPENKFYQFFFKSSDALFKVRIWSKNGVIFYIYKSNSNPLEIISNSLSREDAKIFCDTYIKENFKDILSNLLFDDSYLNASYYMNEIETYKFKYDYKDTNNNKCFYFTVDAKFNTIQEIAVF